MTFEGEIGEIDLVQRLVELGREQFTGAIRFESDGIIKIVYFKGGDVLSASTNDRTDSIDEILLRAGKVTREHIKQALAKRKESETLGDALLGLGFITRKELTWARRIQVIGILRSILGWSTGSFTIVADYLPKREEGTLFPLQQILLELIVTDPDRPRFERAMDGGFAIFTRGANFDDAFRRLGLNDEAEAIAGHIDGQNTAAEIAASSGKDAFNVYKLLEALRVLGLTEKAQGTPEVSAGDEFAAAGVGDAADAWTLDDEPPVPMTQPMSFEPPPVAAIPPVSAMPAWDDPPALDHGLDHGMSQDLAATAPMPAMAPPLAPGPMEAELAAEPEWGFDEAQIETARRAAVPVRGGDEMTAIPMSHPKKANTWGALMLAALVVVLAAAGWYGWQWYSQRQAPVPVAAAPTRPAVRPVVTTPPPNPAPQPPPTTSSAAAVVAAQTNTASTTTFAAAKPKQEPLPVVRPKTTLTAPARTTTTAAKPVTPKPVAPTPLRIEHTASGGTAITNTSGSTSGSTARSTPAPAAASSDATRAKYDRMAKDFAAQAGGTHTVQFEIVCETASVTRALSEGGSNVWFTSMSYRGKPCYRVFWGRYDSAAAANAAVAQLPQSLRAGGAAVVKIPR